MKLIAQTCLHNAFDRQIPEAKPVLACIKCN